MSIDKNMELVYRFVQLPLPQRGQFLAKLTAKGISLAQFPIPVLRTDVERLPLSFAQQRQWFLWQLEPESTAYHMPTVLRLRGHLDIGALRRSFQQLIERHETLRTNFRQDAGQAWQVIHSETRFELALDMLDDPEEAEIRERIEAEIRQVFDLEHGQLLRVRLLRLGEDDHILVMTLHHIVSDGWSAPVMVDELIQLYIGCREGGRAALPALPIQYADYAIWQRSWMEAGERERQLAYWRAQLGDEQPVLQLPTDRARPAVQSFAGATLGIELDADLAGALKLLAQEQGVTLFMVLLTSFQSLLHRYTGQRDIRVGVPIANRNRVETERLIGFFVNTQVLKAEFEPDTSFSELLCQVKLRVVGAQAHQDLPFEQLVDALQPERSLSQSPLFQVMFNHQSESRGEARQLPGLRVEAVGRENHTAQFDLTLDTFEYAGGIGASLSYATALFNRETIERMGRHWTQLLRGVVASTAQRVAELPLLTEDERERLDAWNPAVEAVVETSIHRLIEAQVTRTPEAIALVAGERSLSYAELNRRANRLAGLLRQRGVGPDVRVGIAAERGPELVVGLLGILKAGGGYLPLDPKYPRERLAYMLEDSGVELLLSEAGVLERLPETAGVERLELMTDADWLADQDESDPLDAAQPQGLAYVIYTSGSTGQPKGVGVSHQALAMHCQAAARVYGVSERDRLLQAASISFDAAAEQLFMPLAVGARVVLGDLAEWDAQRLAEEVRRQGITMLDLPPAYAAQLESTGDAIEVRSCTLGGEAWDLRLLDGARGLRAERWFNAYGPTEAVISPLIWEAQAEVGQSGYAPIGRPVGLRRAHLLSDGLDTLPEGLVGELFIGGSGLARGYQGRAALTAERFLPDPFGEPGGRLYRTGDLTRYRADGVIEYVGRIDHQVKIRGFRIELGEIEAALQAHPAIREAVVLDLEGSGGKQLAGYLLVAAGQAESIEQQESLRAGLREQLKAALPDYMVPAHLLFLDHLPLTANGKLDRKALPKPDLSLSQQTYVAPRTALEQRIATIWAEVLKVERVGLTDNFFELGGDSIISLQVVGRARQAGIGFTPKELFQHQTVQGLAAVARTEGEQLRIDQGPVTGSTVLIPVQQEFFEWEVPERHHWNQSVLLKPREPLEAGLFEQALEAMVQHHDALRLGFELVGGTWQGIFRESREASLLWQRDVVDGTELERCCNEAQRSLSLQLGPLLRALLARLPDGSERLLICAHHLVVDGVSWRVLFEDLQTAYRQRVEGRPVVLPAKTSSVKAWAERLQAFASSAALQAERAYWQAQLQGASGDLPRDCGGTGLQTRHAEDVTVQLDKELTQRLLQQAPAAYRTQINDLLLTALARVVARWCETDSILLQLEGHGREDLFEDIDLSRTVGWFTTVFPVRLTPAADLEGSIKGIKEQLRAIPNKGIGFGVLRHCGADEVRQALQALPQPRITFNYLGQFDGSFDGEEALFKPLGEARGAEQSVDAPLGNWLEINSRIYDGTLSLGWTFSREMFDGQTIQRLADAYIQELQALIAHCCDEGNRGVTPSDFPLARLGQAELDALPMSAGEIADIYPLAPMQQGMLFHSLFGEKGGDYINQMRVDVDGLDVERFRQAWQGCFQAHDILRTGFVGAGPLGQAVQVVLRQVALPLFEHDWRGLEDQQAALGELAGNERVRSIELHRAPLLRLTLVRLDERRHHLIYTSHHILMDGWSNSRLLGEVLERYAGKPVCPPSGRYRDYIEWLQRQDADACQAFWKEQLAALETPTQLVGHLRCIAGEGYGDHHQMLDQARTEVLKIFAQAHKVTVNTLVQAAWLLLLQRYTGQSAVCFGATVAGRPMELAGIEQQVGLFINTLPVAGAPREDETVEQWLQRVQALNLSLREYEHAPLFEVQRWAGFSGEALFDSLLVFENYPVSEALQQGAPSDLRFGPVEDHEETNYPLTLGVGLGETLGVHYSFDRRFLDDHAVVRLAGHFQQLLLALAEDGQRCLGELPLLTADERERLDAWNPAAEAVVETSIHRLIEAQVTRTPETIALVAGERSLSYAELNRRANRLAGLLRQRGVGPDVRVGIAAERGPELVVGLLGILKAGGGYLPLDPKYPRERLAYMLEDSGVELLLSEAGVLERLPETAGVERLELMTDADWLADQDESDPLDAAQPQGLAYVIYTSGSTGQPKGVGVSHQALAMHCQAAARVYGVSERDRLLQAASISFDAAAEQLFMPLAVGARVVLGDLAEWDAQRLAEEVRRQGITMLDLPPAYAAQLESTGDAIEVRSCTLGGEAWDLRLLDGVRGLRAERWFNAYGPTEAVISPLIWEAQAEVGQSGYAPIGRPVGLRRAHLLSDGLDTLPEGLVGELFIGGSGLARGYQERAALTAERFLPDPFGEPGGRLYRTGDLTRYRADGVIEYVGRIDHQVKIRGFRIELGEIEACLLEQAAVREAVVLAQDTASGPQLVAYVVPRDSEHGALRDEIRANLKASLPGYMVPAHLLFLDQLPLTPNGKLDRKALPKPDASQSQQSYAAPRTEREQLVAAIWAEVLKVERVGLTDHFFELGGHSLLATQVISRVRQALALELPLRELFEAPTLAAFVQRIDGAVGNGAPAFATADRAQPLVLSYAQQRQWFLWQLEPTSAAYHIPTALRLKGALDIPALQRSFDALVQRHESLRTTFQQVGEQAVQVIHPPLSVDLMVEAATEETLQALIEEEVQLPFDLEHGPLLRVKLLQLAVDEHVLVLTLHHIVTDGWSTSIMVDELVRLYEGFSTGVEVLLPTLEFQYADYALWQRQWMDAGERERQLAYWQAQLGDEQPVLELPTDHPRPAVQSHAGASLDFVLDAELARALKQRAQEQGVTLFMLLLASFQTLLHRYSGQDDIRVGVPIANRNRLETEGLIGFFVNTQVLKATFTPQLGFDDLLQQVKATALGAQAHQDLPFEQLVEVLQPERSLSRSPLFQVVFNHQREVAGEVRYLPHLQVEGVAWENHTAQFDLSLDTVEGEQGIGASLTYCTALFEGRTLERLRDCWITLLQGIVAQPGQRIGDLPLLDAKAEQRLLQDWNSATTRFPVTDCLHQRIEAQAAKAAEATALVHGTERLSYGELNRRANRLAHALRARGVGPDVLVGIAVERSLEMVVGLLGILKAGGAYVPLDPEYPSDRLSYMLEDSGIGLLLTQSHLTSTLPIPESIQCLALDGEEDWLDGQPEHNPVNLCTPDNLAYVIYTSGSTGKPKGTLLPHHNVSRLFEATEDWFQFDARDVWAVFHSYAFDFSVWELFGALLYGGTAVLVAKEVSRSPEDFLALLVRDGVTVLNQTPSAFKQLIPVACAAAEAGQSLALRYVVFGGEALDVGSLEPWFDGFGDDQPQLVNMYGITETTVHVTYRPLSRSDLEQAAVSPIGEVIPDLSWYLLDGQLNPTAPGSHGELHIGRAGLARGYHRRAALTAERFIPDPFDTSAQGGGRLYRSGDLARDRGEGVIEYAGRIDHQVKIRGFRIELGEIEAKLQEHPAIREAVVLDREGPGGKQLVGYLLTDSVEEEAQAGLRGELRERLKAVLPDYMVPAHLLFLEHLPLTGNGKLDRKALPQPDASQSQQAYVAPRTVLEQSIAAIWAEVLKVERVGLTDNFFELGGNSLLLVTLKSRLAEHCGLDVKISQLMSSSTIQELVTSLGDQAPSGTSLIRLNGAQGVASLFLFHPSFGSVHCYKPLALALRHDLPVVGVACRALLEEGMDVPAWDAMVDDYVEQLLQVQPQGPYYLAGWSLGGNLAMDVAHRLEQAGHYVGFLGWIDAPAPMHVTAFWADDTRDEGQVISRDESAVEMLCLLFPASTERIVAAWEDIASRVAEPEVRRQSLSAWAAEAFGAEFQALSQELVVPEVQAVQRIKTVLDQRFAESDYKPVDVPVTCWWAARGKAEGSIESVESSMAKALGRPPFRAGLFDLNHDQLVGHPGFVRSFTDALRRVMTQQVEEATDTRPCGVD